MRKKRSLHRLLHIMSLLPQAFSISGVSPWPKTTHKTIPSTIVRRALGSFKLGQAVSW